MKHAEPSYPPVLTCRESRDSARSRARCRTWPQRLIGPIIVAVLAATAGCFPSDPEKPGAEPSVDKSPPVWANGIAIDEEGYLWIADGLGSQLLRLKPPGTKIVARYPVGGGLEFPDDLVVTPDAVYYTGSVSGTVSKLDRQTGATTVLGYVGLGVNPIALSPSGRLLAGIAPGAFPELSPLFNGLFEIDPAGRRSPVRLLRDSSSINAFCVGRDGFVYGPALSSVVRIDLERGTTATLTGGDGYLTAVRENPHDGRLYVLETRPANDPQAALLFSMESDGRDRRTFAQLSRQPDALYAADNFAIAADGTFYVTRLSPIITRISPDASRIEDFPIGVR